ncbi:MAG: GlsB/YeaQ/YmgE family stress response membrane protein [Acholeplasmataceae bacterium]
MYILLWLLYGALVGWIASIVMNADHRMGALANIVVGLIGSAVGMLIYSLLGLGSVNAFSLGGTLVSIGGAVLLIAIFSGFRRR